MYCLVSGTAMIAGLKERRNICSFETSPIRFKIRIMNELAKSPEKSRKDVQEPTEEHTENQESL